MTRPTLAVALVATLAALTAGCPRPKHEAPTTLELPVDAAGHITIVYGAPDAPPLPVVLGRRVVRLAHGTSTALTSTPFVEGAVDEQYYFVDGTGARTPAVVHGMTVDSTKGGGRIEVSYDVTPMR